MQESKKRYLNELREDLLWRMINKRKVIKIGTPGDYYPFSCRRDDEPEGIDIDILRKFAAYTGVKLKFVPTTWNRVLDDLLRGSFDIAAGGVAISKQRRKRALFSATYFRTGKAPLTLAKNAHLYSTFDEIDRPGVRVIVNPGGTNEHFARKRLQKATLIVHRDNITVFEKILSGEADVMITDAVEAVVQEDKNPLLKAVNPMKPFTCSHFAFMLGEKEQYLKEVLDAWLVDHGRQGGIKKTIFRWTGRSIL
jgi:cyclohexadienyl dehydratase